MSQPFNGSVWDFLEDDEYDWVIETTSAPTASNAVGAGVGGGVGVFLLGVLVLVIAVRRRLAVVDSFLSRIQSCLTALTSIFRPVGVDASTSPMSTPAVRPPGNLTDSAFLEMREVSHARPTRCTPAAQEWV